MNIKIIEAYLFKLHHLPEGFKFCQFQCLPSAADVEPTTLYLRGALTDVYKSGKRKGYTKWLKEGTREYYLSFDEIRQIEAAWSKETGKCDECTGEGTTMASCGVNIPTTYRDCFKCKGTGTATGKPQ